MNPGKTISATFWAMVVVQTIASADIFTQGPRKLPAPKQYVAIGTLWAIFHFLEETRYARLAAQLSVLVLLTGVVLGPFGGVLLSFLGYVGTRFSLAPASPDGGGGASSPSVPSPSGPTVRLRGVTT